ncbi:hypothetical protein HOP52_00315 [Halomonas campisalis]|uniref:Uncharacterized protein n=1 Tax=Billgrantia campisalis TaxID=74661 RepID=A0ABS9P365_9GAMM|nr:hypothetical protein [Halomonas campisalis]MCG6656225.1 hypothetical protein [Halomonas campisalis]MDR5861412.1 hypothetical protein [Halomonas campisalis]
MPSSQPQITLRELLYQVMPQLRASQALISNTLTVRIEATNDPRERARREEQRAALELELFSIRLNVEHLLKRHPEAVQEVMESEGQKEGPRLTLDEGEAMAIDKARRFHERVRLLQQGME